MARKRRRSDWTRARLESEARSRTGKALHVIEGILNNPQSRDCDRLRAGELLLEWGWTKFSPHGPSPEERQKLVAVVHRIVQMPARPLDLPALELKAEPVVEHEQQDCSAHEHEPANGNGADNGHRRRWQWLPGDERDGEHSE